MDGTGEDIVVPRIHDNGIGKDGAACRRKVAEDDGAAFSGCCLTHDKVVRHRRVRVAFGRMQQRVSNGQQRVVLARLDKLCQKVDRRILDAAIVAIDRRSQLGNSCLCLSINENVGRQHLDEDDLAHPS